MKLHWKGQKICLLNIFLATTVGRKRQYFELTSALHFRASINFKHLYNLNCIMDSEWGQECWSTRWERQARDNLISSLNKRVIHGLMGLCRGSQCQLCYEETPVRSELKLISFLLFIEHSALSFLPRKRAVLLPYFSFYTYWGTLLNQWGPEQFVPLLFSLDLFMFLMYYR